MTADPNKTDPCDSLLASGARGESARRLSGWGVGLAVPLFLWGGYAAILAIWGLFVFLSEFLGTAVGGTLPDYLGFAFVVLLVATHAAAMIVAAVRFCMSRWREGVYAMGLAVIAFVVFCLMLPILQTACE
jgi:hypothetical protein